MISVMLDHEGYLVLFERFLDDEQMVLRPGRRIFTTLGLFGL